MTENHPRERLAELLADHRLGQLSPEDHAALEALQAELSGASDAEDDVVGRLILALDEASGDRDELPDDLKHKLLHSTPGFVGRSMTAGRIERKASPLPWVLVAASVALIGVTTVIAFNAVQERDRRLESSEDQLASLREQISANETILADARTAYAGLESELAAASEERLRLAEQLAMATSNLQDARLEIARYEQPVDPAELQQNRQRLLEVPDTIRVAWQPFDLPDAPAEQPGVQGDVVWNNELQMGYLRFVGLAANDPSVEQYQVWVIDERGMEQKVSGGVFNATADGELIVPIEPGIDVGRVAVFAITVENPGGTWVPDLQRRVVVAPAG